MKLDGKVCLITGGTKGIGAATALELARQGAHIAVNGRVADAEASALKAKVEALGRRCLLHIADVSVPDQAVQCVEAAASALGSVDVLVHSAGGPAPGTLLDVKPEDWYRAFDIHIHAAFHLCRTAIPWMKKKHEGAIVFVSSVAGLRGCPGAIAYGVVKGALPQFARSLARDFADDNIRVNCVSPGIIRTRFHAAMTPEQAKINLERRIPLHREGKPEEVAAVIATLATNDFITGENFVMDGGMSMRIV
jgi:NAD(P)-dependent dehydrogenase (short-subunit alcohol dehydrogenase family)